LMIPELVSQCTTATLDTPGVATSRAVNDARSGFCVSGYSKGITYAAWTERKEVRARRYQAGLRQVASVCVSVRKWVACICAGGGRSGAEARCLSVDTNGCHNGRVAQMISQHSYSCGVA